jgi:hypothetical protein
VQEYQDAALAVVELLDVLLGEPVPESDGFVVVVVVVVESLLSESDFAESLEPDSLLVDVERLSLR